MLALPSQLRQECQPLCLGAAPDLASDRQLEATSYLMDESPSPRQGAMGGSHCSASLPPVCSPRHRGAASEGSHWLLLLSRMPLHFLLRGHCQPSPHPAPKRQTWENQNRSVGSCPGGSQQVLPVGAEAGGGRPSSQQQSRGSLELPSTPGPGRSLLQVTTVPHGAGRGASPSQLDFPSPGLDLVNLDFPNTPHRPLLCSIGFLL